MGLQVFQPWSEFVLKKDLPEDLLKNLVELTDIISQDPQKKSYNHTLAGEIENEWQIDCSLLSTIKFESYLFDIISEYIQLVRIQSRPNGTHLECSDEQFLKTNNFTEWELRASWFNEQKDNEYNPIHNHTGILSGVLYLKIPEYLAPRKSEITDGTITFVGDTGPNNNWFTVPQFSILPKEGDIFIFPSTLRHLVYPFRTKDGQGIRRSMSFNIHLPS